MCVGSLWLYLVGGLCIELISFVCSAVAHFCRRVWVFGGALACCGYALLVALLCRRVWVFGGVPAVCFGYALLVVVAHGFGRVG